MIEWILREIGKNPERVFTKDELLQESEEEFKSLFAKGIISIIKKASDSTLINHPKHGRLEVVGMQDKRFGINPMEPENDPVLLNNDEIVRYRFNVKKYFKILANANDITYHFRDLKNGIYLLGNRRIGEHVCGFVFAGMPKLNDFYVWASGIKAVCENVDGLIIWMVDGAQQSSEISSALLKDKIITIDFIDSLDKTSLLVNYREAGNRIFPKRVWLTNKQAKDYDKHYYRTYDQLAIHNKPGPGRNYQIEVNKIEISIAYSELLFLLYFISELKKGAGGWTHYQRLIDDEIARNQAHVQRAIGDVKIRISGNLSDEGKADFLENDKKGSYRISTHPDFIDLPMEEDFNGLYEAVRDAVDEERQERIKRGILKD